MLRFIVILFALLATPSHTLAKENYIIGRPCLTGTCSYPEIENVIKEAYARIGKTVEFKSLPTQREINHSNSGKIDGSLLRTKIVAELYPNLVPVPFPLLQSKFVAISTRPSVNIESLDDIRHYRVGRLRGSLMGKILCSKAKVEALEVNRLNNGIEMLKAGRLDIIIEDEVTAEQAAAEAKIVIFTSKPLFEGYYYHWINKKNAAIIPGLAQAFHEMHAEGVTKVLLGKYSSRMPSPSSRESTPAKR